MKKTFLNVLITNALLVFSAINTYGSTSIITVVNKTEYDFKVNEIVESWGGKFNFSYSRKNAAKSPALFDCFGTKCIRLGKKHINPKTLTTKTIKENITFTKGKSRKLFAMPVGLKNAYPDKYKWSNYFTDPSPVPSGLKKTFASSYPFYQKHVRLVGGSGGFIDITSLTDSIAPSFRSWKADVLTEKPSGKSAILIPVPYNLFGILSADWFNKLSPSNKSELRNRHCIITRANVEGLKVKVTYELVPRASIGSFPGIKIIINPA